jgi:hypothetical protein
MIVGCRRYPLTMSALVTSEGRPGFDGFFLCLRTLT